MRNPAAKPVSAPIFGDERAAHKSAKIKKRENPPPEICS
jgi:hypothetical protein